MCWDCHGPIDQEDADLCDRCRDHHGAAVMVGGDIADLVCPIAYSVPAGPGRRHYTALERYKATPPDEVRRQHLTSLIQVFLADHLPCLLNAVDARQIDVISTVPSTKKDRAGPHPLAAMAKGCLDVPFVSLVADTTIENRDRFFHENWFAVGPPAPDDLFLGTALLIDDLWTTGSRVQSAAYALKQAGAVKVIAVVLGRHTNPAWQLWEPILEAARDRTFDPDVCAYCPQP